MILTILTMVVLVAGCGSGDDDGASPTAPDPAVLSQRCGGFVGTPCPEGYACVGSGASDAQGACRLRCDGAGAACADGATCEPLPGCEGTDCQYICDPVACGAGAPAECPLEGQTCVDDGTDSCDPGTSSVAICVGICVSE
jgi:hypothetical protein